MNEDSIQSWAEEEFKTNQEVIEDLSAEQLDLILEKNEYVLVFVCKYQRFCPWGGGNNVS